MTWWIAQNGMVTAALALVVALACRLLRAGPVARHALWVLVLVKFITPPLVVWPWAVPDPLGLSGEARPTDREPSTVLTNQREDGPVASGAALPSAANFPNPSPDRVAAKRPAAFNPGAWLLMTWIVGSVVLIGLEGFRIRRLQRRVARGMDADRELDARVRGLASVVGVRDLRVRVIDGVSSPMVWAVGRPQLLWPADLPADSSDACIDGLIVHELAHVRRRDHVIGWIELAAGVLWWWNPLFWFVRSSRREQAELACDAWVISVLPHGRRAYAESLLALSGAAVRGAPSMAVVGIRATSRRVLERRLVMIMKGSTPLRLPLAGIAGLAFAAAMTLPAWAMPAQPQAAVAAQAQTQAPPPPAAPPSTPATTQPQPQAKPQPSITVAVEPATTAPVPAKIAVSAPTPNHAMFVTVQPSTATLPPVAMPSHAFVASAPQGAPPPAQAAVAVPTRPTRAGRRDAEVLRTVTAVPRSATLPAEGQQLLTQFDADSTQIQQEASRRIEDRRLSLIKQLEALQDQYTKAGKLDEAIAVRNYLRGIRGSR